MTDIYKKLYGYEDEIQLKDDDIKILEKGMDLRKMNPKKDEFNDRYYKLDLNNNQLVASTKEFRKKEKLYPLISINEVKSGTATDDLKAFKLKKSMNDKKHAELIESVSFVILYDNYKKALDLMAPSEHERDRWVRVLSYFVILTKKRKGVLPETDKIMRNYFELADTGTDKRLNTNEVSHFLNSMNLKLKKDLVKKLMQNADTDGDGVLDEEEFQNFIKQLNQRKEMISLFRLISMDGLNDQAYIGYIPEFMPLENFKLFLERYQKENKTEQECLELLNKFEPTESKQENKFTLYGFTAYMNHHDQFIQKIEHESHVYQDMNQPLSNYFINSSHNTYLCNDQLLGKSDPDAYVSAIMKGTRLVEADCYDGSDGQPWIFHNGTLVSKIKFEDVLIAIMPYAFKLTDYPLIITIEMHCSAPQQRVMAQIIKRQISPEYLYLQHVDPNNLPTLNQLKRKIIFRFSKPKNPKTEPKHVSRIMSEASLTSKTSQHNIAGSNQTSNEYDDDDDDDIESDHRKTFDEISEMSDFLNVISNVSYKGIEYAFHNYDRTKSSSLGESKANKIVATERAEDVVRLTSNYVLKVYPAGTRVDSSNINPILYWPYGFQIAALNFQTEGLPMELNTAMFNDNGNAGYVLKPEILRNPQIRFDPNDLDTMTNKKVIEIKVISAQKLPGAADLLVKDISDPYVSIHVYGVPADKADAKTRMVKDNGFNPIWNQDFKFVVNCPELAFIKFIVRDDDVGKDQLLGQYTIRFENIRCGYRHVQLVNKPMKGTLFLGIKIYKFESINEIMNKAA